MNETKEVSGLEAAVNTALVEIPLPVENFTTQLVDYKEVHAKKIKQLADEADALPIPSTPDEREQLRKHRMSLVRKRTGMNDFRLEFFAPFAKAKKEFDGYVGTTMDSGLQGQIRVIEQRIEAKEKVWDDAQEEIRRKAMQLMERRNQHRAQTLMGMLFHYDGLAYVLGPHRMEDSNLRTAPDEVFDKFVLTAKPEAERQKRKHARIEELKAVGWEQLHDHLGEKMLLSRPNDQSLGLSEVNLSDMPDELFAEHVDAGRAEVARRAEVKRLEAEQNERNRLAFEEQGRKQKQMDEDRAQLDRERAKVKADKCEMRADILIACGARMDGAMVVCGEWSHDYEKLADVSDDNWPVMRESVKRIADECRRVLDEQNAMAQRKEHRAELLMDLGASYDGDSVWTLGEAITTDKLLAEMDDATWLPIFDAFAGEASKEAAVTATIAPVQVIDEEEPPVDVLPPMMTDADIESLPFPISTEAERIAARWGARQARAWYEAKIASGELVRG